MAIEKCNSKIISKLGSEGSSNLSRAQNIILTEEQKEEFIDSTDKKIVYATNFPPTFGAGDVLSIMKEFGVVKMIATSSWNGRYPFNCFIGFEDAASVSTALLWNESQIICADNVAYRQQFQKLRKKFSTSREIRKPIFAFLDVTMPESQPQRILMITTSIKDAAGFHIPMPVTSRNGGLVCLCPRTLKYDFTSIPIDLSKGDLDIQSLPTVPKPVDVVPCVRNNNQDNKDTSIMDRKVEVSQGHIIVSINAANAFSSSGDYGKRRIADLREVINSKNELKNIRNRIVRPRHR